jgi:acetyl esterase/lipase
MSKLPLKRRDMSAAHIKLRVVVPMLFLPLLAFAQTASLPPQPLTVNGAIAYVYKSIGGDQLRLHAFSPASSRGIRKPAIVFFFGGHWTSGAITQFVPQATHLAERGMVAIVADYRVFNRHGTSAFEAMTDAGISVSSLDTTVPRTASSTRTEPKASGVRRHCWKLFGS